MIKEMVAENKQDQRAEAFLISSGLKRKETSAHKESGIANAAGSLDAQAERFLITSGLKLR